MRKNNKSTGFLKECIADALLELLKTKPIEQITVDEIVSKSGVGRATYFRNFHSKQEVLCFKLVRLWERFCDENDVKVRDRFDLNNAQIFFEYNYSIRSTINILYSSNLDSVVFESFKAIIIPPEDSEKNLWYREKFFSYGLFGILDGWIHRDYKETPSEMAQIVIDMFDV